MSNPFNQSLDWALQGKLVRVHTDHGVLEGWVDRVHHNRGSLILHDCHDADRDIDIGSTFVRTANRVDVLKPRKRIEFRSVEELEAHPAHPEEFEPDDAVVRRCYRNQFAGSYPVVREGGTIINGHKRIAAARLAGMDKHPVEVVDVTDAQADELFALAHPDYDGLQEGLVEEAPDVSDESNDVDDQGEPDVEEPETLACDADGCDYTTDTERGLAIHKGRAHGDESESDENEEDDGADRSPTQEQVIGWAETVPDGGDEFHASDIADDLDLHPPAVGKALASLAREDNPPVGVEKVDTDTMGVATWVRVDGGGSDSDPDVDVQESDAVIDETHWCGWCAEKFESKEAALDHARRTHDSAHVVDTEPDMECESCGKLFARHTAFSSHQDGKCGTELPEHVSVSEFEEIAAEATTVFEVNQELPSVRRKHVRTLLEQHELLEEVDTADARSPQQLLESVGLDEDDEEETEAGDDRWKDYSMRGES